MSSTDEKIKGDKSEDSCQRSFQEEICTKEFMGIKIEAEKAKSCKKKNKPKQTNQQNPPDTNMKRS